MRSIPGGAGEIPHFHFREHVTAHRRKADGENGDAEWQQADDAVGETRQFGLSRVDAVLRLKEHFGVTHLRERLRFDMLDVAGFYETLLHAKRDAPSISLGLSSINRMEAWFDMRRLIAMCYLRFFLGGILVVSVSLLTAMDKVPLVKAGEPAPVESPGQGADMDHHDHMEGTVDMMVPHQQHLGPHMRWTTLRPPNAADTQRADQIVQALPQALAKYKDYRVALNDGFVPHHSERKPKHDHFANKERRFMARIRFDPAEPTALLYKKAGDGYELEGAMYTAPRGMSEDQLNERVPLSVAQWHAHVNLCLQPDGSGRRITRKQFGFKGTIATESECRQAAGKFVPQAGGWMIHVYPFESTPAKIWTH